MITDTYAIQALSGKPIRVKKYGKPGDVQKVWQFSILPFKLIPF